MVANGSWARRALLAVLDRRCRRSLAATGAACLLLAIMLAPALSAQPAEPLRFGCDPGPSLPPAVPQPEPATDDDDDLLEPDLADLAIGPDLGRPIDGVGFNLEHALWSCARFRDVLDAELLRPFRPGVARFDLSPFPLAGPDAPPSELNAAAYQAVLASPLYGEDWEMMRRVQRSGARLLLGVWGAPGAFTVDGNRRGPLSPARYDDYVDYVVAGVDFLVRREGVPIWAVTIMNEPDGGDGSSVDPEGLVELGRRLARRLEPYGVGLYGPDTTNAGTGYVYASALLADPVVRTRLRAVASHQYEPSGWTAAMADLAAANGLPFYVTEFTSFDQGDLDMGIFAADETAFMLAVADTLAAHVMDGAQGVLYWDAVDSLQANYQTVTKWGVLEGPAEGFTRRHRYYGLLQLMRYLRPGARPLGTTFFGPDTLRPLAVADPGGRNLVVGLVNRGGPVRLTLDLDPAWTNGGDLRVRAYRTGRIDAMSRVDAPTFRGGRAELWLPARSILTLVGTRP